MSFNLGDWATLAAAVIALTAAIFAGSQAKSARRQVHVGRQQVRAAEMQADHAKEQADAAKVQAEIAERAIDLAKEQVVVARDELSELQLERVSRQTAERLAAEGAFRSTHVELSIVIRKHLGVLRELVSARSDRELEPTDVRRLGQIVANAHYMVIRAEQDASIASARYLPIAGESSRSLAGAVVDARKRLLKAVDDAAHGGSDEQLDTVEIGAEGLRLRVAALDIQPDG